jgi:hypothetical protein
LTRFNELNAARLRGTITNEEATLRQNKINEKVLWALDSFDSEGKVLPGSVLGKKTSSVGILGTLTFYLTGIGTLLLAIAKWVSREPYQSKDGLYHTGVYFDKTIYFYIGAPLLFLAFWSFIAYLLAMVVSALKK